MDQQKTTSKSKTRSPAYPAIGLEDAIAKANLIYEAEYDHFANIEAIAAHWGTTVTNGNFQTALAALKQYSLLIDEGSNEDRKARLTELAKDILEHPTEPENRQEFLRIAALSPKIHRELWEKYKGKLPPDVSIRLYLVREREGARFNTNHVDSFISQFRSTIAYAKLDESDTITPDDEGGKGNLRLVGSLGQVSRSIQPTAKRGDPPIPSQRPPQGRPTMQPGIKEDVFNLEEGSVVVQYPDRLTQDSFEDFQSYLQLVIRKAKRSVIADGGSSLPASAKDLATEQRVQEDEEREE